MFGHDDTMDTLGGLIDSIEELTEDLHTLMVGSYVIDDNLMASCKEAYSNLVSACDELAWVFGEMDAEDEEDDE